MSTLGVIERVDDVHLEACWLESSGGGDLHVVDSIYCVGLLNYAVT